MNKYPKKCASKKCSSTPRELVQISLSFPMMPTEAKGPNLGSNIILTCHVRFISSNLEQFLSFSSTFMTWKFLKVISQTFHRMPISLNFSNNFLRILLQLCTLDWNNTVRLYSFHCMPLLAPHIHLCHYWQSHFKYTLFSHCNRNIYSIN